MCRRMQHCVKFLPLITILLFDSANAFAEEIVVMTSGAFTAAYLQLADRFSHTTHDRFITATITMGSGAASIPNRLERGEAADIVIVASDALEQLIARGRIVPGSRVDLAKSRIAMAVRQGAPRPDISSAEALKRTLLAAESVAYSASVSGNYLVNELFPRFGIAEQMRAKSRRIENERVGAVLARGEAEIGFQQLSELRPVHGIEIVGLLPPEVQRTTVFSAGIAATSRHPAAARSFLEYLVSPAARDVIEESGLELLTAP
jgi:molybdate transport system substrate-binding protein